MIIAANKADLCQDLDVIKKISDTVIPCSAETELLLRKAAKSGIIHLFALVMMDLRWCEGKDLLPPQQKALDLVKSVFSKIPFYWNSRNTKHCSF